jgi:DNA-binding LacI/PurR family transcriptional regulator
MAKRVTIHDVALEAEVSLQTVSRVLNNRPDVAAATRQRVLEVIRRLGFKPDYAARSLRGRSGCIGVVASGLEYFGPAGILTGVEREASHHGHSLFLRLIEDPSNAEVEGVLNELLSHRVEGIIWAVPEIAHNRKWVEEIVPQLQVPLVFISAQPRPGISVLDIDNEYGARIATQHLINQGYQHIATITGPDDWWDARGRLEGWQETMQAAGLAANARQVVCGDWTIRSGEAGIMQLLEQFPEMEAVFVSNDQMALGVLQTLVRMGKRVPQDIAIVGFDDIPEAVYFIPPLTTIRQDLIQLGGMAHKNLCRMITTLHNRQKIAEETQLVKPTLVIRQSSLRIRNNGEI